MPILKRAAAVMAAAGIVLATGTSAFAQGGGLGLNVLNVPLLQSLGV